MESGKAGMSQSGKKDPIKTMKERGRLQETDRRADHCQRHFKKNLEGRQRLSAIRELHEKMSLRRSLRYAGISRRMWYHKLQTREIGLDLATVQVVQRISGKTHL